MQRDYFIFDISDKTYTLFNLSCGNKAKVENVSLEQLHKLAETENIYGVSKNSTGNIKISAIKPELYDYHTKELITSTEELYKICRTMPVFYLKTLAFMETLKLNYNKYASIRRLSGLPMLNEIDTVVAGTIPMWKTNEPLYKTYFYLCSTPVEFGFRLKQSATLGYSGLSLRFMSNITVGMEKRLSYFVDDISELYAEYNGDAINLSGFDFSHVKHMNRVFYKCINLKSADLSTWVIPNVEETEEMFAYCLNLKEIKMPKHVPHLKKVRKMFYASAVEDLDLQSFDLRQMSKMEYAEMFSGYKNVSSIILPEYAEHNRIYCNPTIYTDVFGEPEYNFGV